MTLQTGYQLASVDKPGTFDSLEGWLRWLDGGQRGQIELGLDRCEQVAAMLGLSRPAPTVVTVAGTNGKGSSVALLDRIWRAAGYRVGTYTSPHLIRYNERVRIGGTEVDDAQLCEAFEAVEAARCDVPLTYFEFGTLAALFIFERSELDIAILEVGLGGRLDAVNIVDADVALIATIGLDHEDWLGSTRDAIGTEKAGIMRAHRPVVCSDNEAPGTILQQALLLGAELTLLGSDFAFEEEDETWTWWSRTRVLSGLPRPHLLGRHQYRNASGALQVVELLRERHPVTEAHLHEGLEEVVLHGRFHCVENEFEYVMDVAHNPQAAGSFVATLATMPETGRTHAIVGMLSTKNHVEYLRCLAGVVDEWHFASLPGPQGADAEDLAGSIAKVHPGASCHCHASVEAAHAAVERVARPGERVLVLGSFITVGAMMKRLAHAAETAC